MELGGGGAAHLVSNSSAPPARRLKVLRFLVVVAAVAAAVSSQLLPPSVVIVPSSWPFTSAPDFKKQQPLAPPECVVFNFGDSNSDTGNLVAGAGFRLHRPVGRRFFGKPSGRFSDGRLYIDFICERLGLDHLSPYMESSGVNFRHGANFAVAGAMVAGAAGTFELATQVRQFRHFKARTEDLRPRGLGSGITSQEFQNAVYTFDIGQNDLQAAFSAGLSYERVLERIPAIVARIKNAVTMLHEAGGRKFVLYNTGPVGCLPSMLARRRGGGELDRAGCLVDHNGVAGAFNAQLGRLCGELRAELANSTVVCVDMHAIKYGLVANHTAHGFSEPLMTCCGSGGPPYNYRPGKACGSPKVKACADGDHRISWDGLHYTEAANRVVADEVLSAEYSDPPLRLQTLCTSPS
ncbi:hypothetical protein SEVIR_2G451000v4 [Setaria viridis]|uniref:GDSL esterase/lipase n=1 Tax=Setaria viridis TaxID=4556 RepID=A0A4U6WFF0_SETVI|nr:GDSL esterase/lipase At1g09390-like isoform X2 [Setaria viridis]TKW36597.1 hypothetical protein SEVIR_2G451000v2 [Setaria viridis]